MVRWEFGGDEGFGIQDEVFIEEQKSQNLHLQEFILLLPLLSTNCWPIINFVWPTVFGSGRRKEEIQVTFHGSRTLR